VSLWQEHLAAGTDDDTIVASSLDQKVPQGRIGSSEAFARSRIEIVNGVTRGISGISVIGRVALAQQHDDGCSIGNRTSATW
jgi:hypothetical protein